MHFALVISQSWPTCGDESAKRYLLTDAHLDRRSNINAPSMTICKRESQVGRWCVPCSRTDDACSASV
eukprot:7158066-Alexandrium_andersonii.AAC.1